jgi:hypothetical protein
MSPVVFGHIPICVGSDNVARLLVASLSGLLVAVDEPEFFDKGSA